MANHLAMAAAIEYGDEILIEQPTYEPLLALAQHFGAQIALPPAGNNFQIDLQDLKRQVSPRTRLIVITNLHNPSSMLTDEQRCSELARLPHVRRVLVDEVYLEAMFEQAPQSSVLLGHNSSPPAV